MCSDEDEPPGVAKCRILVVDDLKDSADRLSMVLKVSGHEVHTHRIAAPVSPSSPGGLGCQDGVPQLPARPGGNHSRAWQIGRSP